MTKFQLKFKLQPLEQTEIPSRGSKGFKWYFGGCWGFTWVCFQYLNWDYPKHRLPVKGRTSFFKRKPPVSVMFAFFQCWQKRARRSEDPLANIELRHPAIQESNIQWTIVFMVLVATVDAYGFALSLPLDLDAFHANLFLFIWKSHVVYFRH